MKSFPVEGIPPSSYFTQAAYLDDNFVIAAPEMPFSAGLIRVLRDWDFTEVLCDGEPKANYIAKEVQADSGDSVIGDLSTVGDLDKVQQAEQFYATFKKYVTSLFAQAVAKDGVNFKSVAENVRDVCEFVRDNRRFLMRAQKKAEPANDEDYLISHTVRSTVLAIIIGTFLKLPNHRLIELGVSAVLHEIGMLKLPQECYLSNRPLNEDERKLLYTHPLHGYNLLKTSDFPLIISLAVLEHHERENGSGYPQRMQGDKISLYAKIIAVACSYEAISSKRPHKEAKDGYTGMVELMKNSGKQYNDSVIRALVYSLSIYPIGLYVLLSTGRKGQVIDIDPENPRFPVVQIFGELMPDGKNKTVQTSQDGISIVRPLSREEIEG